MSPTEVEIQKELLDLVGETERYIESKGRLIRIPLQARVKKILEITRRQSDKEKEV